MLPAGDDQPARHHPARPAAYLYFGSLDSKGLSNGQAGDNGVMPL